MQHQGCQMLILKISILQKEEEEKVDVRKKPVCSTLSFVKCAPKFARES